MRVFAATTGVPEAGRNPAAGFAGGTLIGALVGLGGAEFRLPLLVGAFRFATLEAVILNKAMSLIVVTTALPFRATAVSFGALAGLWPVIVNLLAGTVVGAWMGASGATKLKAQTLNRVIAILLVGIAAVLLLGHSAEQSQPLLSGPAQAIAGVLAGVGIGAVAALMGVAGGELLIPTLVILFGVDVKLAGSVSLAISLPTMLVAFARYSQDQSFVVLKQNLNFVVVMGLGSILGTFLGGQLLRWAPATILLPALAVILLLSAWKMWRH